MLSWKTIIRHLLQLGTLAATSAPTVTKSGGSCTVDIVQFRKRSGVAQLRITIRGTTAVNSGANLFTGTLQAGYRPAQNVYGLGYYGSACCVIILDTAGGIVVRNCGASAVTPSSAVGLTLTYLLA